jgi:predicted enzyme related to lactoylglutathione lyase
MTGFPIWYELMCSDVAAVREFYRATLGWDIPADGQAMPNGAEYRIIRRADGGAAGGVLTISGKMAEMGMASAWFPYFHAPEIDALSAKVKGLGGAVHLPPTDMPGAGRIAMLSDPQGAMFYLITPEPPAGQPDAQSDVFSVDRPGRCRWNEITTTDGPGAKAFYTALFGWTADNAMPMGPVGDYVFIEADGVGIGAINPMIADGGRPHWGPVFGAADIDAAKAAAEATGGTITHDIHQVPGDDYVFYGKDPAGAKVAFVGPKGA